MTKPNLAVYGADARIPDGTEENEEMERAVFTGDTLLVGGCGRIVEGDAKDMYNVLYNILGKLPKDTKVYCGHECARLNLQKKLSWSQTTHCTVPSTIEEELEYNPYLRVSDPAIQQATGVTDPYEVTRMLRALNDTFMSQTDGSNGLGVHGINESENNVNEMNGVHNGIA
ncbi:3089_t:CDS:2, partial [Racocetra fulgida]